jgi:hypothetical protein
MMDCRRWWCTGSYVEGRPCLNAEAQRALRKRRGLCPHNPAVDSVETERAMTRVRGLLLLLLVASRASSDASDAAKVIRLGPPDATLGCQ